VTPQEEKEISSIGTILTFLKKGTCSETLVNVLDRAFGHPLELEERAAVPLAGGIVSRGYQCGMLWGATLAAGAQAYRLFGPGPQAEAMAIIAAQRLVESFTASSGSSNCRDITGVMDMRIKREMAKYLVKGGPVRCFRMAPRYASVAFREINSALSGKQVELPSPPVSCSAMVARRMGASDMHAVMAAGFAGGIGLSGGACGALGAAIWIRAMNRDLKRISLKTLDAMFSDTIDDFAGSADFKFECSEIVGRRFEGIGDHAGFLRDGGCAEIIEILVTE
jgi:Putative redox-active protein (C_GCAxxG_C_C)